MHCESYSHFFSKKFQHICVSLGVNFNESLANDIVSFEQLGPGNKMSNAGPSLNNFSSAIGRISWGLKNDFELATINKSSVYESLRFIYMFSWRNKKNTNTLLLKNCLSRAMAQIGMLTLCRLNRLPQPIYWKSPISILGTSSCEI